MTESSPKKPYPKPPSEEFCDAFSGHTGSLVMECGFCGRLYFGTNGDYEKGEREGYEERAKTEPDRYISVEGYSHSVEVDGKIWVLDCKCNGPRRYEDWIWSNRYQIMTYLKTKSVFISENADKLAVAAELTQQAVESLRRMEDVRRVVAP